MGYSMLLFGVQQLYPIDYLAHNFWRQVVDGNSCCSFPFGVEG